MCNIWELETIGFPTVDVKHGDGSEGSAKSRETEDEHRSGVGGIGLVGFAYTHRDDGTAEVLDEEDHGVCRSQTFQGDDLRYTRPEGCWSQGVADAEDDHQGDGDGSGMHRHGETEMDGGEHQSTCDDERHALAVPIMATATSAASATIYPSSSDFGSKEE